MVECLSKGASSMQHLTTLAFLAITIPVLAAPHGDGDCFCKGLLEPGMTVHTTVANPWGAANLEAGDCGMVACSNGIGDAVLVVWFNWYNGDPHAGDWCGCGHDDPSPGKGWWVSCDDLKPGCPPARGACCMQGECVWATRRVCDSRDGLYFGDGLSCEDVCDCGEGWQHEDIDADGDVDFQDFLRVIQGWGPRDGQRPDEDIDGDCVVGVEDLLRIFEHWGPPPLRGACCLNQVCIIETEDDCIFGGGRWWGGNSVCDDVMCVDAAEIGEELCNCDGDFRVGDRVTLLRTMRAPGLILGKHGTTIAAHDPEQGAYQGMITVLWDQWVEERPDVRSSEIRHGLWAIHCGWHAFFDRWSTTKAYCQDLLSGEHDIDTAGACCIDGNWCRLATAESCLEWGGSYAGNGTSCKPEVCDGPVECACEGTFNIGDRVELNRHVDWGGQLQQGRHGHVLGASEASPGIILVYFDNWRSGNNRDIPNGCGYLADMADRLDYMRVGAVPCDSLDRIP